MTTKSADELDAEFDRVFDLLSRGTTPESTTPDPAIIRRERFFPIDQLVNWVELYPPCRAAKHAKFGLLNLAMRHIDVGHLKTHGPSKNIAPNFVEIPTTVTETVDGQVTEYEATIMDFQANVTMNANNPLVDVFDFGEWFAETGPEFLKLPDWYPVRNERANKKLDDNLPEAKIPVLEATLPGNSLNSGNMRKVFAWTITKLDGDLASEDYMREMFGKEQVHCDVHRAAKLVDGGGARDGQKTVAAKWDPVLFALWAIKKGRADLPDMNTFFEKEPYLAPWRNIWKEKTAHLK